MLLDLSELQETGSFKEVNSPYEVANFEYRQRNIESPEDFHLEITIYSTKDSFILSGNLKGELVIACSRCLEKFVYKVDIKLEEELPKDDIPDFTEVDIGHILNDSLLLAIPPKPLCSDDCNGLCAKCGQNLNHAECECEKEVIDPRLAKLEKLLEDDKE